MNTTWSGFIMLTYYGEDFTHGFDTQNYPKSLASLGTQSENTHGIQSQTQPIPVDFFRVGLGNTHEYLL